MTDQPTGIVKFTKDPDLFEVDGLTRTDVEHIDQRYADLSDLKVPQLLEIARRRMVAAAEAGKFDPSDWIEKMDTTSYRC